MTFHEKLRNIATTWRERVGPSMASLISLDIDALGGGCQFCSLALAEFQGVLEEAQRLGARVLAISPEKPEYAQQTIRDNKLTFDVLYDREGRLADAVGIRYEVSDIARTMMRSALA